MERIYANELERYLGELAYHFYMAGEWTKVLEYAQRTGEKAQALLCIARDKAQRLGARPLLWGICITLGKFYRSFWGAEKGL